MAAPRTTTLDQLLRMLPQRGRVTWIGLRPARGEAPVAVASAEARPGGGLTGDRFKGSEASKRQVTLIQAEHLAAVASLLGRQHVDPALTRRNVVVAGINLFALRHARFRVGDVLLEGTGICTPCANMEAALGAGGFNAMRGHGGITSRVLEAGVIRVGDEVSLVQPGALGAEEN
jgi:MOSC domain-containing protein YiiM